MSKITFRADDELVERIEARDASKSEIMREALRSYLDRENRERGGRNPARTGRAAAGRGADYDSARDPASRRGSRERARTDTLDALLAERVDELVAERLAARETGDAAGRPQGVNVNVTLESDGRARADATRRGAASDEPSRTPSSDGSSDGRSGDETEERATETTCGQCGESLSEDHVYCPNCGEKAARRLFCECGDEVRSDWGFCPSCGRRTPAANVLDQS